MPSAKDNFGQIQPKKGKNAPFYAKKHPKKGV